MRKKTKLKFSILNQKFSLKKKTILNLIVINNEVKELLSNVLISYLILHHQNVK